MSSIEALDKIKHIYDLKYEAAIAKVAILEKEHADVQAQLDEILVYYNEYCDYIKKQSSTGVNIHQLKNQYQFINQFIPVISQQNKIITRLKDKIISEKFTLLSAYQDLKALEHILENKKSQLLYLASKQEDARQEEEMVSMHLNKINLK